jgi:putative inorganic carbon (hco3(-)) transporter
MVKTLARLLPSTLMPRTEQFAFLTLAGSVSLVLVSIAASQILLAASLFGVLWMTIREKKTVFARLPILLPLLVFIAWMAVTALASSNVLLGLTGLKKVFLFLLIPLVPCLVRGEGRITWIYHKIFIIACLASLLGIAQYIAEPQRDLLHRISGTMSQWMTYSGLIMLVLVLLAAYALCTGWRSYKWAVPTAAILVLALVLSLTRNTLAGAIAGIFVLVLMRRPRAIAGLMAIIVVLFLLSPAMFKQRFQSVLNPDDPNTRNRIEISQAAIRLISANPWLGVGPKNVQYEALKYRVENKQFDWMYQHMHNNFLQVAAEMGIPGLLIWLWLMIRLAWDALSVYRCACNPSHPIGEGSRKEALIASSAALGAWIALLIAGVGEYNFGDSEVLTLFLFIMSAPYAFMAPPKQAFN